MRKGNLLIFATTPFLLFAFQNFSFFSETVTPITEINTNLADGLNFNKKATYDFNNDGVNDIVSCTTDNFVKIIDGTDKSKILYNWAGPNKISGKNHILLSGCEFIKIKSVPVIVISNFWMTPTWRAGTSQYLIYNNGSGFTHQTLEVENFGTYKGVSRSIDCGQYPLRLVQLGYTDGALCFISDYAQATDNHSALLKLEWTADGKITAKDLSSSAGIKWKNGVRGTSIWDFGVLPGFASNQRDGGFMMGSAFIDYDHDGLTDFVTVGQHAKVLGHRLFVDANRAEGVGVSTEVISSPSAGQWTEYLAVRGFNYMDGRVDVPCLYFSGEGMGTPDHIRCHLSGAWSVINLPKSFSSQYGNAFMVPNGKGQLYIKTTRRNSSNEFLSDLLFTLPYTKSYFGDSFINQTASSIRISGWACLQNDSTPLSYGVYSAPIYSANKKIYSMEIANLESGPNVQNRCMQPQIARSDFETSIAINDLQPSGKKSIYSYLFDAEHNYNKLISVHTYQKNGNVVTNLKKLPMTNYPTINLKWTNKGLGSFYSLDIIDEAGNHLVACQDAGVLGRYEQFDLRGKCSNGRPFNNNPSSLIRICTTKKSWNPVDATCSIYQPLFGPEMMIEIP